MSVFAANWTIADLVRTALDRTARGGVLQPQDDFPIAGEEDELPYDRLTGYLAEHNAKLHDLRQHVREKGSRGVAHGTRTIAKVTALCWHQMATPAIDEPRRTLGIPSHVAILRSGDVVLQHPVRAYMYHGHTANAFSVGVEIACRAAGTEGDRRTFWRSSKEKQRGEPFEELVAEATDRQLASAFGVGVYIVEEIERQGGKVVAQMFHRNSHKSRTSDPGSRIAREVVLPLAVRFGHEYGGPKVGTGHPTPPSWGGGTDTT